MKQHMREFFVARIRSGRTYVEARGQKLYVVPTTIEQDVEAANIYMDGSSVISGTLPDNNNCLIAFAVSGASKMPLR